MDANDWLKDNEDEIVEFLNKAFAAVFNQNFGKFLPSPSSMSGDELVSLIVDRLREIPQSQHYEMIASYGLAHEFLGTLQSHGISVYRHGDKWWVQGGSGTYFPVRVSTTLPHDSFVLVPRDKLWGIVKGGEKKVAKKRKKKKKDTDDGGGGY